MDALEEDWGFGGQYRKQKVIKSWVICNVKHQDTTSFFLSPEKLSGMKSASMTRNSEIFLSMNADILRPQAGRLEALNAEITQGHLPQLAKSFSLIHVFIGFSRGEELMELHKEKHRILWLWRYRWREILFQRQGRLATPDVRFEITSWRIFSACERESG